jgi:hypothetical protein
MGPPSQLGRRLCPQTRSTICVHQVAVTPIYPERRREDPTDCVAASANAQAVRDRLIEAGLEGGSGSAENGSEPVTPTD